MFLFIFSSPIFKIKFYLILSYLILSYLRLLWAEAALGADQRDDRPRSVAVEALQAVEALR